MKTKLYILIAVFFMSLGVNAQIDRSQQPKPGPAPKISLEKPQEFELKNGLKILVVENHKLPRVSFNIAFDREPVLEGEKAGVTALLGAMLANGTTSISKDDFNEEIDFLGARLNFGFGGGSAGSITKYGDRMLELLADAAMNPLLTEEEFQKEKEKLIEGIKSDAKSVDAIAGRVGGALAYGKQHPYGEFITEESVEKVTLADVKAYFEKYFTPNNTYLVIIGDVDTKSIVKLAKKYFKNWEKATTTATEIVEPNANPESLEINFIDMPNAVQSNISLTSNVKLKMSDPDYHAVLIANKILGGGFNSYLNMNLREEHGYTYGARSSVGTDKYISRFRAGAAVRNAVTDSAVVETLKEIKRFQSEPVEADALANAKAKYVGDFVLALERPSTIAQYAISTKVNELPEDFYATYLEKINAVSIEDVNRVANLYFTADKARIVVVGKGSEVIGNLEKTGIPINYFDTFAHPVEKPEFTKPIPAGVTAATVLENYITAIGGLEAVNAVNSVMTSANVTIEGMPFKPTAVMKTMAPNMSSMEMSIEGMGTVMKQKFDGSEGYAEQQGMQQPMSEDELAEKSEEKGLFPETYLDANTLTLVSLIAIDGVDVYKIRVKEDSYRYYDASTGLLMRTEKSEEAQGQKMTSVQDLSDYREVNGVLFPYSQKITTGPQIIGLAASEIIVNDGVTAGDFK
ncbi:MAG: pitrilysin family protein [Flavobacteriaceae bacterium]|nr:pitrilysin family protein [Flavobacteriaceae bacterium]